MNDKLRTTRSFLPAGFLSLTALALFLLWPQAEPTGDGDAESLWPVFFLVFHYVAALLCLRGCLLFLTHPADQPRRAELWMAVIFASAITLHVIGSVVLFWLFTEWTSSVVGR